MCIHQEGSLSFPFTERENEMKYRGLAGRPLQPAESTVLVILVGNWAEPLLSTRPSDVLPHCLITIDVRR